MASTLSKNAIGNGLSDMAQALHVLQTTELLLCAKTGAVLGSGSYVFQMLSLS